MANSFHPFIELRTLSQIVETRWIYEGLVLADVEYKRRKRSFRVEMIAADEEGTAVGASPGKSPSVPAFVVTESSVAELIAETGAEPRKKKTGGEIPKVTVPARAEKAETAQTPAATAPLRNLTFGSIGGLNTQIESLRSLLTSVLEDAEEFARKGLVPPRGILLYGPPGTGKTMMLKATACEMKASSYVLDGKVMGKYMGESEAAIRQIFGAARKNQPSIIFMDEVDSLAPKRSQGEGSEGRVVSTLLTEMDGLESSATAEEHGGITRVAIVAATSRPNAIDEALRRAGRFEKEVEIGIPDADARREILDLLTRKLDFEGVSKDDFVGSLASRTHGYVGADLEAVVRGAFTLALDRRRKAGSPSEVMLRESDVETALIGVKPTAMREIFLEAPKVRWSDIGGQEEVKQRLREAVEWPLTHPQVFARLGGTPRKGLLLYGPPGCSKTLTAKALATETGLNFMAVKGPELFNMYVGESERAVREVFRKARAASPSIIFFDEIDALSASREGGKAGGGGNTNVLTALLNEMDGIETLKNVVVLAATNRPELIVSWAVPLPARPLTYTKILGLRADAARSPGHGALRRSARPESPARDFGDQDAQDGDFGARRYRRARPQTGRVLGRGNHQHLRRGHPLCHA